MREIRVKASLTVEAALVFPVFFYAVMAFCCLFIYMEVNADVERSMAETVRKLSTYGTVIEELSCLGEEKTDFNFVFLPEELSVASLGGAVLFQSMLATELTKYPIAVNTIQGGTDGVSCYGSVLTDSGDCMRIKCEYTLKAPVSIFAFTELKVNREIVYRYFTGHKVESMLEASGDEDEPSETEEETVYKTETGTVYHLKLSCPSLKVTIKETNSAELPSKRNVNGGKYYPCEKCVRGAEPLVLYITTDGDRYHFNLSCSGLKRTIMEIKKSEAGDLRECKRCGKKEE